MKASREEYFTIFKLWMILLLVLTYIGISIEILSNVFEIMISSKSSWWLMSLAWITLWVFTSIALTIASLSIKEIKNWLKDQFGLEVD